MRRGSLNKKLIQRVHAISGEIVPGLESSLRDYKDFDCPLYDGDDEARDGIPAGAMELVNALKAAERVIISTPEYNGSIPGTLKNIIDWTSRAKPIPWEGKRLLLLAASPGALGGTRCLWHARQPFEVMKAFVHPEMFGLAKADKAFDDAGEFTDPANQERVKKLLRNFFEDRV